MKKILITTLLFSSNAFSHSQAPTSFDIKTLTRSVEVELTIMNLSDDKKSFDMLVDDEFIGVSFFLNPQESKDVKVKLMATPDIIKTHNICSFSKASKGEMFNTKVCSRALIDYPLTRIKKIRGISN